MTGRRPIPANLKLITGKPGRGINLKEPRPIKKIPDPPVNLSPRARSKWSDIAPMLLRTGVLTEADGLALAQLVEAYADHQYARAELRALHTWYYETTNARSGATMVRPHPAVAVLQDSDRRLRQWLAEFGLTPSTRARLKIELDDETDPAEKYFSQS